MTGVDLTYADIKALSKALGRPAETLVALAQINDPFYITPARQVGAQWFAQTWDRLNIPVGWHYRRIHYVFVSQDTPILKLDDKPYTNTLNCWAALCVAARDAIALELVPQDAFADHRNAEPIIYLVEPEKADAYIDQASLILAIPTFPPLPRLLFGRPTVPQPYHIEVWAEKTTVNDILEPLAVQYQFNLVTGIGELSATRCREFVDRAARSRRPVRVLYVSDFDPAGASMPVGVARKIEFELRWRGLDLEVQLRPIVLTHEQCVEHKLPRTPIKKTERRARRFEERFGEGATELDALEALHPGLLRQIMLGEVKRYWNPDHDAAVEADCEHVENEFRQITAEVRDEFRSEIDALKAEWQAIREKIVAWSERAEPIWEAIANELEQDQPELEGIEWSPEFTADEDPDPLFDSRRDYVTQIDRYKAHQGKPTSRKPRANRGAP